MELFQLIQSQWLIIILIIIVWFILGVWIFASYIPRFWEHHEYYVDSVWSFYWHPSLNRRKKLISSLSLLEAEEDCELEMDEEEKKQFTVSRLLWFIIRIKNILSITKKYLLRVVYFIVTKVLLLPFIVIGFLYGCSIEAFKDGNWFAKKYWIEGGNNE